MTFTTAFAALVVVHFLCDYPLQGDFLARNKNPRSFGGEPWWWAMSAHAAIHGGAVWWLTGWFPLGLAEFFLHFVIDTLKCQKVLTFGQDQGLHLLCKLAWVLVLLAVALGGTPQDPGTGGPLPSPSGAHAPAVVPGRVWVGAV